MESISPDITRGGQKAQGKFRWNAEPTGECEEPVSLSYLLGYLPWQRLYFLPLLQGHFSLRPILWSES